MKRLDAGALAYGAFFLVAGIAFLLETFDVWDLRAGHIWPILLIGLGVAVVVGGRRSGSG